MPAKVLIVDDIELNVVMLEAMVGRLHDSETLSFLDAGAALDWCAHNQPDLVLLDYLMPGIDGIEFLRRLRRIDHCRSVPVLVITADQDNDTLLKALEGGANDFVRKPFNLVEFQARVRNALRFSDALAQLRQLATTDGLTGLLNRRAFLKRLDDEHDRATRYGQPFSVAVLDVDHFKRVNDRFGHAIGDLALIAVADACRTVVRKPDVIGRLGGEEFALILPATIHMDALVAAERLRSAVAAFSLPPIGGAGGLTVSIGLAEFTSSETAHDLLRCADEALYDAKANGRNLVKVAA